MQTSGTRRDIWTAIEAVAAVGAVLIGVEVAADLLHFAKGLTILVGLGATLIAALAFRIAAR